MKTREKVITKNFNNNDIRHNDATNLTKEELKIIKSPNCNCEYKRNAFRIITWFFLLTLAILVALILTVVVTDII